MKFGLRLGKVVGVDYRANTIDVILEHGGGFLQGVMVAGSMATTNSGRVEMPVLKTVKLPTVTDPTKSDGYNMVQFGDTNPIGPSNPGFQGPGTEKNYYHLENVNGLTLDLEDKTTCYTYAIVGIVDESSLKTTGVCLGFVYPFRNQMVFDPENVDTTNPNLPQVVKTAVSQMKGGLLHRTNSGVYWSVDLNGNTEWFHPNGTFFRIAETPTQAIDNTIHVDLTGANRKAVLADGTKTNMAFDATVPVGIDGTKNSTRYTYAHFEVVTAKGIVELDIDKLTGNVTIKTPKDESTAAAGSNTLTIICGGDAILESVQGNVTVQSANQNVTIEAANNISVKTDNAQSKSIVLAPNVNTDYLPLFTKLAQKFNKHTHMYSGGITSGPSEQLEQSSDATTVTVAG